MLRILRRFFILLCVASIMALSPVATDAKTIVGTIIDLDANRGVFTVQGKAERIDLDTNEKTAQEIMHFKLGDKVDVEYADGVALSIKLKKTKSTLEKKPKKPSSDTAELDAFIRKAKSGGFIHKIETYDGIPFVYVGPSFYTLSIDGKANMMKLVFARYMLDKPNLVVALIKDGYSGKDVGKYTKFDGLTLE